MLLDRYIIKQNNTLTKLHFAEWLVNSNQLINLFRNPLNCIRISSIKILYF